MCHARWLKKCPVISTWHFKFCCPDLRKENKYFIFDLNYSSMFWSHENIWFRCHVSLEILIFYIFCQNLATVKYTKPWCYWKICIISTLGTKIMFYFKNWKLTITCKHPNAIMERINITCRRSNDQTCPVRDNFHKNKW